MIQIEQRSVGTNWCHSDEGETPAPSEIADYTKLMISICSLNLATICWQLSIVIQPLQPWLMTRTLRGKQAGVCWPLPPQAPIYRKWLKNWANRGSVFCSFDMLRGSMLVLKRNENWITSKEKIVPEDLGVSMTNICCIVVSSHLSLFSGFHFTLNDSASIQSSRVWCLPLQQCDILITTADWADKWVLNKDGWKIKYTGCCHPIARHVARPLRGGTKIQLLIHLTLNFEAELRS